MYLIGYVVIVALPVGEVIADAISSIDSAENPLKTLNIKAPFH